MKTLLTIIGDMHPIGIIIIIIVVIILIIPILESVGVIPKSGLDSNGMTFGSEEAKKKKEWEKQDKELKRKYGKIEQNKKDWCNACNKPKSECTWEPDNSYGGSRTDNYDKNGNYIGHSRHYH